jgi:hypothetical protein
MLQRWRAALSQESPAPTAAPPGHADLMVPPETIGPYLAREARASVALDGDTHCVDAPAAPTPGTKTER